MRFADETTWEAEFWRAGAEKPGATIPGFPDARAAAKHMELMV